GGPLGDGEVGEAPGLDHVAGRPQAHLVQLLDLLLQRLHLRHRQDVVHRLVPVGPGQVLGGGRPVEGQALALDDLVPALADRAALAPHRSASAGAGAAAEPAPLDRAPVAAGDLDAVRADRPAAVDPAADPGAAVVPVVGPPGAAVVAGVVVAVAVLDHRVGTVGGPPGVDAVGGDALGAGGGRAVAHHHHRHGADDGEGHDVGRLLRLARYGGVTGVLRHRAPALLRSHSLAGARPAVQSCRGPLG